MCKARIKLLADAILGDLAVTQGSRVLATGGGHSRCLRRCSGCGRPQEEGSVPNPSTRAPGRGAEAGTTLGQRSRAMGGAVHGPWAGELRALVGPSQGHVSCSHALHTPGATNTDPVPLGIRGPMGWAHRCEGSCLNYRASSRMTPLFP